MNEIETVLLKDIESEGADNGIVKNKKTGEEYTLRDLSGMFGQEDEEEAFREWLDEFVSSHKDMEWI